MVLAIDIGNTDTVIGVFSRSGNCEEVLRFPTVCGLTGAELTRALAPLLGRKFSVAMVASVVPEQNNLWREVLSESLKAQVSHFVSEQSPWGFRIGVTEPARIGHDRLCNIEAALRFGGSAVVVDAGTATKFDVLKGNVFLGGAIAPGFATSFHALVAKTAQLNEVSFEDPITVVGKNTNEALRSGAVHFFSAAVNGMITKIFEEQKLPFSTPVVITGGHFFHLRERLQVAAHFSLHHTLEGLYAISRKL